VCRRWKRRRLLRASTVRLARPFRAARSLTFPAAATAAVVGQGASARPALRAPASPRPPCDGKDDDAAAYAPLAPDVLAGGAGCGPGVSRDSLGGRGAQLFVLSHLQGLLRGNPKMPTDTQALAGVLEGACWALCVPWVCAEVPCCSGKLRHKHLQLDNPQAAPRHLHAAEACGRGGAPTRALASARASRQAGLYSIPSDHRKCARPPALSSNQVLTLLNAGLNSTQVCTTYGVDTLPLRSPPARLAHRLRAR